MEFCKILTRNLRTGIDAALYVEPTARSGFEKLKTLFVEIGNKIPSDVMEAIEDEFNIVFDESDINSEHWSFGAVLDTTLENLWLEKTLSQETLETVFSVIETWCRLNSN
jgi:hypothetical protein